MNDDGAALAYTHPYRGAKGLTAEAVRILQSLGTVTIATVGPDGLPHMAPVWFAFDVSRGCLYFESHSKTRKVRNIAANGVASILAKGPGAAGETLTILGQGAARIAFGDECVEISQRIRSKYLSPSGMKPVSQFLDGIDDVAVELRPSRWVTWNASSVNDAIRSLPEYREDSWSDWFRSDQA